MNNKKHNLELVRMREALLTAYPEGWIRGRKIVDMPENQVYAIYKNHIQRHVSLKKPRMKYPEKQIRGQMDILSDM